MSDSTLKQLLPCLAVLGVMSIGVGLSIYQAGKSEYTPQAAANATYIIHANSPNCFNQLMAATSNRSKLDRLAIKSFIDLKKVAESCGGTVELLKHP